MLNYLLYNCNASVNAQRFDESTALHIAAGRGMLDLTARLLVSGADLSITNSDNETPLDHASPEVSCIKRRFDEKVDKIVDDVLGQFCFNLIWN